MHTRRNFITTTFTTSGLGLITSCDNKSPVIVIPMFIALHIGKAIKHLPHPALRITTVILKVGVKLVISYLQKDNTSSEQEVEITPDESDAIQGNRVIIFEKDDGSKEEFTNIKDEYS